MNKTNHTIILYTQGTTQTIVQKEQETKWKVKSIVRYNHRRSLMLNLTHFKRNQYNLLCHNAKIT
jgi:hypothetical protein